MIKREELSNPNSCLNKAEDDEILFVFRDKDLTFADVVRYWIGKRIQYGLNKPGDAKLVEAEETAQRVQRKQQEKLEREREQNQ